MLHQLFIGSADIKDQITQEKLLVHLERGLVNSVCFMGIEINSCFSDPYQRTMLPFISGLGPRKADSLVNGIQRVVSRSSRRVSFQLTWLRALY